MVEEISKCVRKARKPHRCDYCGETIEKGERYQIATLKFDGELYNWRNHERCGRIAAEIWDFIDPDEGMSEDDFCEGCQEICRTFICPWHCTEFDREAGECRKDESFCTKKMDEYFKTHDLIRDRESGNLFTWKCVESRKEGEADGLQSAAVQKEK